MKTGKRSVCPQFFCPQFLARFLALAAAGLAMGQQPITVGQAIQRALKNYPAIRVSQEQINAAAAGIRLARTAYLPHADALAQLDRGTRNNVFGLVLPQSVIPSISGPVLGTNNFGTTWGTALGVLVSWEPFDFGLRRANLAVASALEAESEAALKRTEWIQAQQAADMARATLSQFVAIEPGQIDLDVSGLLQSPPEQDVPALDP